MFNKDFFPTPAHVIEMMTEGYHLNGKTVLEPSAGKGDIVDFCIGSGASVIACEKDDNLRSIVEKKCPVISNDFFAVTAEQVSHIDFIIMNPPFSADEKHILHAYSIAPEGCHIIALCNASTLEKPNWQSRKELKTTIEAYGHWHNIGDAFATAERKTGAEIALIKMQKPGAKSENEFEGFFLEDDQEPETGAGLMPYNFVRDLVNRYVEAVKVFDDQLNSASRLNDLIGSFYGQKIAFTCSLEEKPLKRAEFKKELQKGAWNHVFHKMKMEKFATKGLKQDINRFVEQQQNIPFTMRNIYRMLDIVIYTHGQRMDKATEEVFERLTQYYDENRYNLEGWKTNSHYLLNPKFILPYLTSKGWHGNMEVNWYNNSHVEIIEDLVRVLCYITGSNYESFKPLNQFVRDHNCQWGEWYEWGFFEIKGFKKGTMHFRFVDENVCWRFNQHVARIKGFPLPEAVYRSNKAA